MRWTTRLENPQLTLAELQEARPRSFEPELNAEQFLDPHRGEATPDVGQQAVGARGGCSRDIGGKRDGFAYVLRAGRA